MRDVLLGARLTLSGGRPAFTRTALTAVGVGLGVLLLLFAASVPSMIAGSAERNDARTAQDGPRGGLRIANADTSFRGEAVTGLLVEPVAGRRVPLPPGVRELPARGTMVASPDLADLLRSDAGALLRPRLPQRIVGTIGPEGLKGPRELVFYAGAAGLAGRQDALRVRAFGLPESQRSETDIPFLNFLIAIAVVILLVPVGVFISTAARFGGEDRDRRLAAVRLVGADRRMATRIAAGESLLGALAGIVVGGVLFLALRPLTEQFDIAGLGVFASDVRPRPVLAALVVVLVPAAAVTASIVALRRVVVEPLGVFRRTTNTRRRLWWRLLPTIGGVALLWPMRDAVDTGAFDEYRAGTGVFLVLIGITAFLPWAVEAAVGRLQGAGPLSWQLAARRLQVDGGTAARVVSGVAVAVAGAIALQSVFTAADREENRALPPEARDAVVADGYGVGTAATLRVRETLRTTPGVRSSSVLTTTQGLRGSQLIDVVVADCATLDVVVRACRDGEVYVIGQGAVRGRTFSLGLDSQPASAPLRWTVPADADSVGASLPAGLLDRFGEGASTTVVATPAALDLNGLYAERLRAFVQTDPGDREAVERVRNVLAGLDVRVDVATLEDSEVARAYRTVRRSIYAGAMLVLLLIGSSLLVGGLEQLRDRRRALAVLGAVGMPRATIARSVLWQAAVPVALGLTVSAVVGVGLGALLLAIANAPTILDWAAVGSMLGMGAVVVLLVTALTLPSLWRHTAPSGLRTE